MYLRYIHFCCKQKCEISTVDCTQIKDLNNLCVRPTIACKQAKLGLDSFHYVPVEMTYKGKVAVLGLDVNGK